MPSSRDLLKNLLEYIEEQAKEIDPKGYCISNTKGFVKCNPDLAGLPGLEFDLRIEGDHIWLQLKRLEANRPPVVADPFKDLFKVSNDPFSKPPLLDENQLESWIDEFDSDLDEQSDNNQEEFQQREQLKHRAQAYFEEYLFLWKAWVEKECPRRRSISLYGDLFALKHQMEADETAKPQELVWGIGISIWQILCKESIVNFKYPVLTQSVEIFIDDKTMALEVRPRDTITRVEMDAFIACSITGATEAEIAIKEQLQRHNDRPVTPFDASSYTDILALIASNLDSNGKFLNILTNGDPIPDCEPDLLVTDAWVLLSRPRTTHYLIDDLKRLKGELDAGCDIPLGLLAFVTEPSNQPDEYEAVLFRGLSSRGVGQGKTEELYFPLPYNEEQVTIVSRLEKEPGVVVQGPPGTGKTHTIANVICHYLAKGKRVLVTSRGETALEVLQSKIPEEVRALTVALMSSDREGVRQFQASIAKIQHQVSQLNREATLHDIENLKSHIDRTHNELSIIDKHIDEIAMKQLSEMNVDGVLMPARKLAEEVISGGEQYRWFDDDITLSSENAPPLSEEEACKLCEARRKVGQDLVYIKSNYPSADSLPIVSAIAELHKVLSSMRIIDAEVENGELLSLIANTDNVLTAARELLGLVEEAITLVEELESLQEDWPFDLRVKCRLERFATARRALEVLFIGIDSLIEARAEFLIRPVDLPVVALNTPLTLKAIIRGVENGKPIGIFDYVTKGTKQHIAAIKVAGHPPGSKGDWSHVQKYIHLHEKVISISSSWNQIADELSLPCLEASITSLLHIERICTIAKNSYRLATHFDSQITKKAEKVFSSIPNGQLLGGSTKLQNIKVHLLRHLKKQELSEASTLLSILEEKLEGKSGPVSDALRQFVKTQLGNPNFSSDSIATQYKELLTELRRIASLSVELTGIKDYARCIEQAGASKLASRILSEPVGMSGEETIFPVNWRQAWNWARMRTYLDHIEARAELVDLSAKRREHEIKLSRLYKELVSKTAWLATKKNATHKVLQALQGYVNAISRIGQGTGPNATRYRRDAREAMLDAADAVPCWIMNHARISEAMPPEIGAFDLVIVDEASQSDLWALPAILRGKKILVVGDDKQVSPDGSFISSQRIDELRTRFLTDQFYQADMTQGKSLYDLASRVFAGSSVMLREHFRCVPPIIAYSNKYFYTDQIQPLRIPTASERIEPPLVDIYIPDGFRDRRDINDYEAQAIAEEISAILDNVAFMGRTIGVVSLLSSIDHVKHIDTLVRKRCDGIELLHRKFECGDARTFQGSERDIIFLSMVADKSNHHALSGLSYEQRFNVAASRARDRMYLIRSVELNDLSVNDNLRRNLIEHFNKPIETSSILTGEIIELCDSGFEREVFSTLSSLGYRVIPQVKAGAYRIDMVVEGSEDCRLAIELDGDPFHGPDRWQHDMERQRILERAGWVFWRCFASTWTLRKDEVLQELKAQLAAMGIEPIGATQYAPNLVEKRIWKPSIQKDEEQIVDNSNSEHKEPEIFIQEVLNDNLSEIEEEEGDSTEAESNIENYDYDDLEPKDHIDEDLGSFDKIHTSVMTRRLDDVTNQEIQNSIIKVLSQRPDNSCIIDNLTAYILKELGVRTHGSPRLIFGRRIKKHLNALERKGKVEQYTTKTNNKRVRLRHGDKTIQSDIFV